MASSSSRSQKAQSLSTLPESAFDPRRHVGVHLERVSDVSSTEYPGHYPDEDHTWDLEKFRKVCFLDLRTSLSIKEHHSTNVSILLSWSRGILEPHSTSRTIITTVCRVRHPWCGCVYRKCLPTNHDRRGIVLLHLVLCSVVFKLIG